MELKQSVENAGRKFVLGVQLALREVERLEAEGKRERADDLLKRLCRHVDDTNAEVDGIHRRYRDDLGGRPGAGA